MLVILVAQEFRRHSGEKPKGNDAGDLGCVSDLGGRRGLKTQDSAEKGNYADAGDLGCVSDLGCRLVFENA